MDSDDPGREGLGIRRIAENGQNRPHRHLAENNLGHELGHFRSQCLGGVTNVRKSERIVKFVAQNSQHFRL